MKNHRSIRIVVVLGAFIFWLLGLELSGAGTLGAGDSSFLPAKASGPILALALQPDGKLVVGGEFTNIGSIKTPYLARLNPDGSIDTGFNPGAGPSGPVRALIRQSNGKVFLGGSFTDVDGHVSPALARLNSDGNVDPGFKLAVPMREARALALQEDGKLIAVGSEIVRVDAQGNADSTFSRMPVEGGGLSGAYSVAIQPDGKILVGGVFTANNDLYLRSLVRLEPDGSIDPTFNAGWKSSYWRINAIALQKNGKILIGGEFRTVQGHARLKVARLNSDGSLDLSFDPTPPLPAQPIPLLTPEPNVTALAIQEDGGILLAGPWGSGIYKVPPSQTYVNRLRINGSLDEAFNYRTAGPVLALLLDQKGGAYAGGSWDLFSGGKIGRLFLEDPDLPPVIKVDPTPQVATLGNSATFQAIASSGSALRLQWRRDGRDIPGANDWQLNLTNVQIGMAGEYSVVAGNPNGSVTSAPARLSIRVVPAGWLDPNFVSGSGANGTVHCLLPNPDGKILVGGAFSRFNDQPAGAIVRLEPDGRIDREFDAGSGVADVGTNGFVKTLARQSDGKILVGGKFRLFNGSVRNGLVRLHPDGRIDDSFQAPPVEALINAMALQSDGRVILGGRFTWTTEPFSYQNLVRLSRDGALDRSLNAYFGSVGGKFGSFGTGGILAVAVQSDERIVVAGDFAASNFQDYGLVRYLPDGRPDTNFAPGLRYIIDPTGLDLGISSVGVMGVQADGRLVVAGTFNRAGQTRVDPFVRLKSDGTLDNQFKPDMRLISSISQVFSRSDGKLLVAIRFLDAFGVPRSNVIQLEEAGQLDPTFDIGSGPDGEVRVIAADTNGDILMGGDFTRVNGMPRGRIARLFGSPEKWTRLFEISRSGSRYAVQILSQPGKIHVLEYKNLVQDTAWKEANRVSGDGLVRELVDAAADQMQRFYRIRSE